jgi:hypothetical protein
VNWAAKYVGIPFVDGGCSYAGCSCWGLVRMVLQNERGIELPSYGEIYASDLLAAARRIRHDSISGTWLNVVTPKPFDVAVMYAMHGEKEKVIGHVGVMSSETDLLHVWKETDAVNMSVTHPRVRYKIVGFYRHRDLTGEKK